MKKLWCLIAVAGMLCGCASKGQPSPPSQPAAAAQRLRVMTYNIHIAQGMDGKFDPARTAKVIKDANPDLVALQEVDRLAVRSGKVDQPQVLADLTGMHAVHVNTGALKDKGEYGPAILSRWPLKNVQRIPLPYGANREPRAAIGGEVEVPNVGPILFIATHLQHNSDEDRVAEARLIVESFSKYTGPSILGGDLNATPGSKPLQVLTAHWTDASPQSGPTSPSVNPRNRIDYILCAPGSAWRTIETTVIEEQVASDHRPVLVVLEAITKPPRKPG